MGRSVFLVWMVMGCVLEVTTAQDTTVVIFPHLTSGVNNFYHYNYDGGSNFIRDGGHDMYDGGNQVSFSVDGTRNSSNYNTTDVGSDFTFSSQAGHPFLAFFDISTTDHRLRNFSIQVVSDLGADGGGRMGFNSGSVQRNSSVLRYNAVQSYGTSDPTICEVYFTIHMSYNGTKPTSSLSIGQNNTRTWNNRYDVQGLFRRSIVGYTLLSKYPGERLESREIESVLVKLLARFQGYNETVGASVYNNFTSVLRERLVNNLPKIAPTVENFYNYRYDDPLLRRISDGGGDMYDNGNQIIIQQSLSAQYNTTYRGDGFSFTSVAKHPFTAFFYIYGTKRVEAVIEVNSNLGTDGGGRFEYVGGTVSSHPYYMRYNGTQVFATYDPSICEIYFTIDLRGSSSPNYVHFDLEVLRTDRRYTTNRARLASSGKVVLGYTLLSKARGERLNTEDIESALLKLLRSFVGLEITPTVASFNCSSQSVEASLPESYVRSVLPEGDVFIVFLDQQSRAIQPGCASRYQRGLYIAESHYGMCAAQRMQSGGDIVEQYRIMLASSSRNDSSLISHDFERAVMNFECRFPASAIVTLGRALVPAISSMRIDMGNQRAEFTLEMARYVSSSFTTISTDSAVLQGSTIYIALTLEGTSGLVLQANDCTVSELEDGSGPESMPLLTNGCPESGPNSLGVQLHPQHSRDIFAFSLTAFIWRMEPDEEQNLWISCTATVCTEDPGSCLEDCNSLTKRRRSINIDKKSEASTRLSLGPFDFQTAACDKNSLECSHQCTVDRMGKGVCSCPAGHVLLDDGKTCAEDFLLFHEDTLMIFGLFLVFLIVVFIGSAWTARKSQRAGWMTRKV